MANLIYKVAAITQHKYDSYRNDISLHLKFYILRFQLKKTQGACFAIVLPYHTLH